MAGSHAGVSIGEDGPSQMALEDLSMMTAQPNITVLYPSDAVCAERLVAAAAHHHGPGLHPHQPAEDAGHLRQRRDVPDRRLQGRAPERDSDVATVIGAGVTLFEALKAYDELKQQGIDDPRDRSLLGAADRRGDAASTRHARPGRLITVEDHYVAGRHRRCGRPRGGAGRAHGHAARGSRDSAQRQARRAARQVSASRPATSSTRSPTHSRAAD